MTPPSPITPGAIDWQEIHRRLAQATAATEGALGLSAERGQAVLAERARLLARVPRQAPQAAEVLEVLIFSLGAERYAVETWFVRKVERYEECAPVPGTPEYLAGVVNLRGDILAVFDPSKFFHVPGARSVSDGNARVIVMGRDLPELGLVVDAVHEVATVRVDEVLEAPASVTGASRDFINGVTRDALIVIDGHALLHDDRLVIDQAEETGN
jgi:purine-binding chemotaxis protein CheW